MHAPYAFVPGTHCAIAVTPCTVVGQMPVPVHVVLMRHDVWLVVVLNREYVPAFV